MHRKLLATAICASLALPLWATTVYAQDDSSQTTDQTSADKQADKKDAKADEKNVTKLKGIQVTGSLLPRSQIETSTPTIQITAEDMKQRGFSTVADALKALPQATGSVQGAQFSGGFTQGAQTIGLLGLDPGFTLLLIDGKPMADYPLLYNGSGNFVDLSNIPSAMVDHIDIVPGNQSAIYGSSAIAGVINIILKQNIEGLSIDLRGGGYSEGGGGNQRVQITGGHKWDKLNLTYSLELRNQRPIYRYQRSWFDSNNDRPGLAPGATRPAFDYLRQDLLNGGFIDPGQANCDRVKAGFDGTEVYGNDAAGRGHFCGSPNSPAYSTIMNGTKSGTGYVNLTYALNDNAQLYANVLYNVAKTNYFVGTGYTWWGSGQDIGVFYNPGSDKFESTQYTFDVTPAGIGDMANEKDLNRTYIVNLGLRGNFGASDWAYDLYFHRSDNQLTTRQLHPVATKVDQYFLGDQQGVDPYYNAYPAYNLNLDRFYSLMSPADYRSISEEIRTKSETYTQELTGTVSNTNLFDLAGGSAGLAVLMQYGDQKWTNPTDPRLIDGYFWGLTGTQGGGKRDRYAGAVELNLPVTTWLTANASARYDSYKAGGRKDSKATYKLGLEFRPFDSLLIRGTYATAFRSPDMSYLFSGPSGFYTSVVDYYRCRQEGGDHFDPETCTYNNEQVSGTQSGNADLKNITAKSITAGIVWSPSSNFNIHADYYNIKIDNEVSPRSIDGILSQEADCRIGHTVGGSPVDINSPTCKEVLSLVDRNLVSNGPLQSGINSIATYPINISGETVKGVTAGAQYRVDAAGAGDFVFGLDYNVTLKHTYKQYPGDPTIDTLTYLSFPREFKNRASASVTWNKGIWSTTLFGIRNGETLNYATTGKVGPWITYNASIQAQVNDQVTISLIGNNVLNKRAPIDRTYTAYPFYDGFNYDGYGRSIMAELNWKLF